MRAEFAVILLATVAKCSELHEAAKQHGDDHLEIKALIVLGANIEEREQSTGWTPLHWAARRDRPRTIEALVAAGASVEAQDNLGWTPLHHAASLGRIAATKTLLAVGASVMSVDESSRTPLHLAAATSGLLHSDSIGVTDYEVWVELPNNPELQGQTIDVLLKAGAGIDAQDFVKRTPLFYAAIGRGTNAVQGLLAAGANAVTSRDVQKGSPLHSAALTNNTLAIRALIGAGAALEARDESQGTPLHWAAKFGAGKAIEELIAAGAVVDALDDKSWTPLHHAAKAKHKGAVKALLAAKDSAFNIDFLASLREDLYGKEERTDAGTPVADAQEQQHPQEGITHDEV